jgi:hypothetical protein
VFVELGRRAHAINEAVGVFSAVTMAPVLVVGVTEAAGAVVAGAERVPAGSTVGRLLGRGNPTALNRGRLLQPRVPSGGPGAGRWLPYQANPGLADSPIMHFLHGAAQGGAAQALGTDTPAPSSVAQELGQQVGRIVVEAIKRLTQW